MMQTILIVEDDKTIAESICFILEKDSFNCKWFDNGKDALEFHKDHEVDLILLDVDESFGIRGKKAETVLDEVNIFTNKNMVPNDRGTPYDPCGIRLGTPAITTRGMKESEMQQIAKWYVETLKNPDDAAVKSKVKQEVLEFIKEFPLYPDLEY